MRAGCLPFKHEVKTFNDKLRLLNPREGRGLSERLLCRHLESAEIDGAEFSRTNLKNAVFKYANVSGTDFTGARNLTHDMLASACYATVARGGHRCAGRGHQLHRGAVSNRV